MNHFDNFNVRDFRRIVEKILTEQSQQNSGTTVNTGSTTNTGNTVNTGTTSNTGTTKNSNTTQNEPTPDFGTDRNAIGIEKRIEKDQMSESYRSHIREELNRMIFLSNYERGVVLSEQKKNLFESDGSDTEKPPFDAPIVKLVQLNKTEWRVYAFGTFPVNVTSGTLATTFMDKIVEVIFSDPTLSDPQYKDRITMTVAHIFGGASNYNAGPVMPDKKATIKDNIISYDVAVTGNTDYTGKYETNLQLAKNRATNLFNLLKAQLPIRVEKSIKITAKPEINGYNVDTGGVVDKDRNSRIYPVPGQHVNMALLIKIKPKKPTRTGSLECMKNLIVTVKSTPHSCDGAAFKVSLNKVFLGDVDLGNYYVGTNIKDPDTGKLREMLPGTKTDGKQKGERSRTFKIDASNAAKFVTSQDGSVTISLKGYDSKFYEDRWGVGAIDTYKGKITTHADVPYVLIFKKGESGTSIIYDQAPTPNTYVFGGKRANCGNDGNPCKEFDLLKFNPCATNVIDGDLTGF